ncbi:MAG: hypothetical protein HY819_19455 [Acidobacteria bacterium]|nr:hypothetical protein [Acidobacteriota bacterium]
MLGQAKPYFTLILQSEDRAEVEKAAQEYKKNNAGAEVVIDSWRDHINHLTDKPLWRARAKIIEKRSLIQQIIYLITR